MLDAIVNPKHIEIADMNIDPIREFYTRYPYPPPVENLDRAREEWDEIRRRSEFHLIWPEKTYRADLDILVAGCGTWQAAKYALCRPDSRVVAIDVSTTSLEHTERLKAKYDLSNLMVEQITIEDVAMLGRRFDLVVCTGVLHHLKEPDKGLRALRSILKPDGAIYLMVYAPYGRAGIYLLQDYCKRLGVGTSVNEINDLASVVEALPPTHPLVMLLRGSRDQLTADALADALLNPRDRSYSVPQVFDLIDNCGLSFGRWYWNAPYDAECGSIAATPHKKRLKDLPDREQFASMELWRGSMTNHSFLAFQDEAGTHKNDVFTIKETFGKSVPHRRPTTILIEENIPTDAAGVLLNRSHQFHDLVMPIGENEKQMFDKIDGIKDINAIALGEADACRPFFEKLWRYDQVVFDFSRS